MTRKKKVALDVRLGQPKIRRVDAKHCFLLSRVCNCIKKKFQIVDSDLRVQKISVFFEKVSTHCSVGLHSVSAMRIKFGHFSNCLVVVSPKYV